MDLEKEIKKEEKKIEKAIKKINLWMIVSIVLAIVLLLVIMITLKSGISKEKAGQIILDYGTSRGVSLSLLNVTSKASLYEVIVLYQGSPVILYVTKDGKYMGQMSEVVPATNFNSNTETPAPAEVPKTDKPKVDLYIFSYCPYGTQVEKGIIPVYNLLKNKADINIVAIGAMHGEFEKTESLRQICIQKLYGKDILMNYLNKFDTNSSVGSCQGTDSCVNPIINSIFSSLKISASSVNSCMTKDAPALYSAQEAQAQSLGISGSPTLVVNGVETQSGRSPAALLSTICSAFTTQPSECSQTLDSATPSAGFGGSTGASSGASCG